MLVFPVMLLLVVFCVREVSSMDLGFHIRMGRWIVDHKWWPRTDPLTYTLTDRPYVDLHWLYQVAVAALYALGGTLALVATHAILILSAFALSLVVAMRRVGMPALTGWLFLLALLASEVRFMVRPEALSWLLLSFTVLVLELHASGRRCPLWLLPGLQVLWVNVQGLFMLGWVAMACYLLGGLVQSRRLDRRLALWCGVSVAAAFLNPYFATGVAFPLLLMTRFGHGNVFGRTIAEFQSPWRQLGDAQTVYPATAMWAYCLLAAIGTVALLLSWRRRRINDFLLFAAFLALSMQAVRNIPLFALVCMPIVADALEGPVRQIGEMLRKRFGPRLPSLLRGTVAVALVIMSVGLTLRVSTNAYYIAERRGERFGYGMNRLSVPVSAAEFLRKHPPVGKLLNHINFGGYLGWQLDVPVFIDARLEVVGEEFYTRFMEAVRALRLAELAAEYGAGTVVFPFVGAKPWFELMRGAPGWRLVHFDELAAVFMKEGTGPLAPAAGVPAVTPNGVPIPVPEDVRAKALGMRRPSRLARWLEGFWRMQEYPRESINRALFCSSIGNLDGAESYTLDALISSGGRYYDVYHNLGVYYLQKGLREEAARCFRIVLDENPSSIVAREQLAALGKL